MPQAIDILAIGDLNPNTKMFTLDCSFGALPGQFVMLWIPELDEKPFSIASDDGKQIKLAIAAIGPFSKALFQKKVGDQVGIRGAFGNSFSVSKNKRVALVGGGFGTAPLHFLGKESQKQGSEINMLIGARSNDLLIYEAECKKDNFRVFITTNDGSAGEEGFVTAPLTRLLQKKEIDFVQTCGPEKMMEAVAKLCREHNVPCELSLERYMKCGFGICGQCICDKKLVCQDGCVFSGEEALSLKDFGSFHRDAEGKKEYW